VQGRQRKRENPQADSPLSTEPRTLRSPEPKSRVGSSTY